MISRFFGALHYLTILAPRAAAAPGESAIFFPIIGAALGWFGAQWLTFLDPWLGNTIATLLMLALWALLTGARQETGMIASHGHVGIVAVVFLTVMRWQAIIRLPSAPAAELAATLAASRAALVALAWLSRPIGDEPRIATHLTTTITVGVILQGVLIAFLAGPRTGLLILAASSFTVWLAWRWFDHKKGGVDTHCLHAATLFLETLILILISCRNCI